MSNPINKLAKRKFKLPKSLATKLVNSQVFNKPKMNVVTNLNTIREAFNSPLTSEITKGVILSCVLDDSVDYSKLLSNAVPNANIGIQLVNSRKGYYFTLTNQGKLFKPKSEFAQSILKSNQVKSTTNKLLAGLENITDKTQFRKALNATLWINSYLGQISKIADFIRSYIRKNDPQKLWYIGKSPDFDDGDHIYRFQEIKEKEFNDIKNLLAKEDLQHLKNELSRFDWFANSIKRVEEHETLKAFMDAGIQAFDEFISKELPDASLISNRHLEKIDGNPELLEDFDSHSQSLLNGVLATIGDWAVSYGERDLLEVDFEDESIIDNFLDIHGNSQPPVVTNKTFESDYLSVNPRNSDDFRKVSSGWKKRFK